MEAMDFRKILTAVLKEFDDNKIDYALIGCMAFGFWGVRRGTEDIDFLIKVEDSDKTARIMEQFGYETFLQTKHAAQYIHKIRAMGEIDFLYASREYSRGIINRAKRLAGTGGIIVKVATPEDLIGMKLQGIKNDPAREYKDMADMQMLIKIHGNNLDWNLIKEYCNILQMDDTYGKLIGFAEN